MTDLSFDFTLKNGLLQGLKPRPSSAPPIEKAVPQGLKPTEMSCFMSQLKLRPLNAATS